ncbi:MAG: hypothetical protein A2Y17_02805 [Clostridiales bacterium GWF2_38_85]|nr:MAG: hypothetical protein A2Y17_02805 [Clostridiales bacterium GWF2_38_85]HBL85451.1 hypothetical protein [Clostridiales bacterium]
MLKLNKHKNADKGFTLIEIIVVIAMMAILVAITVPPLIGSINKAKESDAINECRIAVLSAQSLYIEKFSSPDTITLEMINEETDLSGVISVAEQSDGILLHLTYINDNYIVTYCRDPQNCALHTEAFTLEKYEVSESSGDTSVSNESSLPEESQAPISMVDYFYIANDLNYRVSTLGDLATYDFGPWGSIVPSGSVFYWQGDYYYTRDGQYLTNYSNLQTYLNDYGVKINKDEFIIPNSWTEPGDLKLSGGRVYIFFPYWRYYNDYLDYNYWFEVYID